MSKRVVVSVQQLNSFMKKFIEHNQSLQSFYIKGEVSGHKVNGISGHHYFSLKDDKAQVPCILYASFARYLKVPFKDGDTLICRVRASYYERDGKFQLYVEDVEQLGQGVLYQNFLRLKEQLAKEGLFASAHKRPLPLLPKRVAVITSASGAVIRDIIKVGRCRYPNLDILLFPCTVQGDKAAAEMVAALNKIQLRDDISVIIIGRGGGSLEDLWCFNDESLARAIYASKVPVVAAVGHETDFTIADYVADLRASTPSNAAELVFIDQKAYLKQIADVKQRLTTDLERLLAFLDAKLAALEKCRYLDEPEMLINERFEIVDKLKQRLLQSLKEPLVEQKQKLKQLSYSLNIALKNQLTEKEKAYCLQYQRLLSANPLLRLEQGYAYVSQQTGEKVSSVKQVETGSELALQFIDGNLRCKVTEKNIIISEGNEYGAHVE